MWVREGNRATRDNAEVGGVGAGESKRKEFKYSSFKNSCPCKITEMKAETQLVEEASTTCSYCQSSAHCRTVQPLCELDCSVQTCSVLLLHRAEDCKPQAGQPDASQTAFKGSHIFRSQIYKHVLGPHGRSAGPGLMDTPGLGRHSGIAPSHVDRVHPLPEKQASPETVPPSCRVCEHYVEPVQPLCPKDNTKALKLPQDTFGRLRASWQPHC